MTDIFFFSGSDLWKDHPAQFLMPHLIAQFLHNGDTCMVQGPEQVHI